MIVVQTVLPVFIVTAIGYMVGKAVPINAKPISFLAVYVLSPSLFFHSLVNTSITGPEFLQIMIFIALLTISIVLLVRLWARITSMSTLTERSVMLSTVFPNSANFGLPIVLYTFGTAGFERGIIFAVLQNLLQNTLGVYLASNSHLNARESLLNMLRMPGFWAMVLGLGLKALRVAPPDIIMNPLKLIGQAAIPVTLLTLGIQLAKVKLGAEPLLVGGSSVIRLVGSPLIGILILTLFFDPSILTSKVILLQSACPIAVTTTMLAIQFDARPEIVSNAALITTVVSIITISVLLSLGI